MSAITSESVVETSAPPSRWAQLLRIAREVLLIIAICAGYRQVRMLTKDHISQATGNAWRVVDFERHIGVFTERGLQRFMLHSRAVIEFLNHYYVGVHFPLTALFVMWVVVRHADVYGRIRTWFIWVTAIGLFLHVVFPLAPPRLALPGQFIDTLRLYGPNIYKADLHKSVTNQVAAMPSLHFGWAVLVAVGFRMIKGKRWATIAFLHPFLMLMAIVATGNHYWADAGVALLIVGVVLGLTEGRRARRRKLEARRAAAEASAPDDGRDVVVAPVAMARTSGPIRVREPSPRWPVVLRGGGSGVWCSEVLLLRPLRV